MSTISQRQRRLESQAIYYGGAVAILATLLARWAFGSQLVSFFGQNSVANVASVLGGAAALVGFLLTWRAPKKVTGESYGWIHRVLISSTMAFLYAAISVLMTVVLFFLTDNAFVGLRLDPWTAAVLSGLVAATCGYIGFLAGPRTTSQTLSTTLAVFMVAGAMVSMITSPNPYWWQIHFSSLGAGDSASASAFNVTLTIGGIVMIGLADLIASEIAGLQARRADLRRIRVGLLRIEIALVGLMLMCVGLFAYDTHLGLHNLAATLSGLVFLVLTATLGWVAPGLPRAFYGFTYAMSLAIVVTLWLFQGVGYFNLTATELTLAGIIFAWFVVFVRQIAAGLVDETALAK